MKNKISAWNINLATNTDTIIPNFVGEEILKQDSDFFVLTEFCKTKNHQQFCKTIFLDNGYEIIISNNAINHNDILISWKKDKYKLIETGEDIKTTPVIPNFSYVVLENLDGIKFVLAGVRITIEKYCNRKEQFKYVLKQLHSYEHVIIAGDFNCLRRGTHQKIWNINILNKLCKENKYELKTPKGSSIYTENALSKKYEFAEDHFVTKGVVLENEMYDRNFTEKFKDIYLHNRDFTLYNYKLKKNIWSIRCGSGVPDHAILTGFVNLNATVQEEKI